MAKDKAKKDDKASDADEKSSKEAAAGAEGAEGAEGEGQEGGKPKKKLSGRTLVLFIALPAVLLIGGGVAAAFMLGLFGGGAKDEHAQAEKAKEEAHAVFFDMPEILVNLSGGEGQKGENFLKLVISLELPDQEAIGKVEAAMPRIVDGAQVFLREMRVDDFDGSAGMLRLREELLRRVSAAVAPLEVKDVLFKEIIVQ